MVVRDQRADNGPRNCRNWTGNSPQERAFLQSSVGMDRRFVAVLTRLGSAPPSGRFEPYGSLNRDRSADRWARGDVVRDAAGAGPPSIFGNCRSKHRTGEPQRVACRCLPPCPVDLVAAPRQRGRPGVHEPCGHTSPMQRMNDGFNESPWSRTSPASSLWHFPGR